MLSAESTGLLSVLLLIELWLHIFSKHFPITSFIFNLALTVRLLTKRFIGEYDRSLGKFLL